MTAELKKILEENNLAEYIELFEQHKISDVNIVSELNESELETIGISALGDRKKIVKLFSQKASAQMEPASLGGENRPAEVVIHHATKSGDDVQTGLGKGFGETVGKKAGGCLWSVGVSVITIIVIAIVIAVAVRGC
jgi:preprotein translocase subunit SecF